MPCTDYRDAEEDLRRAKAREDHLNKLTRMLCTAGHTIEEDGEVTPEAYAEFFEWWEDHKKIDKRRAMPQKP